MKISDYFLKWVTTYKQGQVSEVTFLKYLNTHSHVVQAFGDNTLNAVNREMYQLVFTKLGKDHAQRTLDTFNKHLRAMFDEAIDEGLLDKNPTRKVQLRGKPIVERRKALGAEEWKQLLASINVTSVDGMMIYLAATTGMRYAEVAGLTREDIDFNRATIKITRTWNYKYGGGFMPTKNSSSIRTITIDDQTLENLKAFIKIKIDNDYGLLFWGKNNRILHSSEINKTLTSILERLNINRISFHGLRHTHASVMLFYGMPVLSVSRRLGHSNIQTTQNVYLHMLKEMELRDTKMINNIFAEI